MVLTRAQRDRMRRLCDEQPAYVWPSANLLALLDAADAGDDARALLEADARAQRIAELERDLGYEREQRVAAEASIAMARAELALLRRVARAAAQLSEALQCADAIADAHDQWRALDEGLEAWRDYTHAPSGEEAAAV
jgi:hypothetical protein